MLDFKKQLINKTGGLFYHYKAFKYKNKYWKSFKHEINKWALSWPQKNNRLLIIGSSAGYTLEDEFLNRYSEVHCIDLDKLAPALFNALHKNKNYKLTWDSKNYLKDLELLQKKLNSDKQDILFSNILGQLPLAVENWETHQQSFISQLHQILKTEHWASYHDLYSSETKPNLSDNTVTLDPQSIFNSNKRPKPVIDHMTKNFFTNGTKKDYFVWQIEPKYYHLIEATYDL
ncbi:hypothetical protein N9W41_00740 [bacterium]|nr:hypothetical protein [bacterium]